MQNHAHSGSTTVTRRQALGAAGVAGAAAALSLAPAARAQADEAQTDWDVACDVLVVGFGGAGAAAAISAADAGAQVLMVDKAPEYLEGGNTRYSEQVMVLWHDEQDGYDFLSAMAEGHEDVTDEVKQFMARESVNNFDWVKEHSGGAELNAIKLAFESEEQLAAMFGDVPAADILGSNWAAEQSDGTWSYEEYPIWPDGQRNDYRVSHFYTIDCEKNHKGYWEFLRSTVEGYADSVACWFNSPATRLIQDGNGIVVGAVVDHNGTEQRVFAKNGVVLACGSYESDPVKVQTFAQRTGMPYVGTSYNTGDGIDMAARVGAQMWHMAALSGPYPSALQPGSGRVWWPCTSAIRATADGHSVMVCANGKRFMPECGYNHHGHVAVGDTWQNQQLPSTYYAVMDATGLQTAFLHGIADGDQFVCADTVAGLAKAAGIDAEALEQTVQDYNRYCDQGHDDEFNRYPETLEKIETAPFYAIEYHGAFVNVQGGPKRDTSCQVLDVDGDPIPRLYSAGELGSFWGGVYIAGGNVAETCYTGRVAGANAAQEKGDLVAPEGVAAPENEITVYDKQAVCGVVELGEGEYAGCALGIHGPVVVKVGVSDGAMASVEVVEQHESPQVVRDLFTAMPERMVEANSVDVDGVTGATIATRALRDAVADALVAAGLAVSGEAEANDMNEQVLSSAGSK